MPADMLRELHRLLRHTRKLQEEIDQLPQALKAQQSRVTRAEENLLSAQEGLKKLKVSVHDKEGSLKSTFQQIAKYERQLNEASVKKEYDALQHEIDAAKLTCSSLEDEILTGMAQIDDRTVKIPELEKTLKQVREDVAAFEKDFEDRKLRLRSELDHARAELAAIEQTMPVDMRPTYQRLVQSFGADALSAVDNKTCSACYSTITVQQLRELDAGRFVTCKTCGKILYYPA